jgi:GNAT superfamily N-acetyltransferase
MWTPARWRSTSPTTKRGRRVAFVGLWRGELAGYVTLLWASAYPPFAEHHIPEVSDFAVRPAFRRRGIGTALLDHAESAAATRGPTVGIGQSLMQGRRRTPCMSPVLPPVARRPQARGHDGDNRSEVG